MIDKKNLIRTFYCFLYFLVLFADFPITFSVMLRLMKDRIVLHLIQIVYLEVDILLGQNTLDILQYLSAVAASVGMCIDYRDYPETTPNL